MDLLIKKFLKKTLSLKKCQRDFYGKTTGRVFHKRIHEIAFKEISLRRDLSWNLPKEKEMYKVFSKG